MKPESVETRINQETTQDLINIHNFITSIVIAPGNYSCFQLQLMLQQELEDRAKKSVVAKEYLNAMDKLLGVDKIPGMKQRT